MTKYKLEDFKTWLETHPQSKERFASQYITCEKILEGAEYYWPDWSRRLPNLDSMGPGLEDAQEVINKWAKEVDQKRRERKSKDLENQQAEIKQLQSKITLLEQQKNSYQAKFNNSLQFIKEVRKSLTGGEEWKPKSANN